MTWQYTFLWICFFSVGYVVYGGAGQVVHAESLSISAQVGTDIVIETEDENTGSSGYVNTDEGSVSTFSGVSYPGASVYLLLNGVEILQTTAKSDATFSFSLGSLSKGVYMFAVVAEDTNGNRSTIYPIPVILEKAMVVTIKNIFISPTVILSAQSVVPGSVVTITGQTVPFSIVHIDMHTGVVLYAIANQYGKYSYTIATTAFPLGEYLISVKATSALYGMSAETNLYTLKIVPTPVYTQTMCGDINADTRVNLIDFSILAYWYGRVNPPQSVDVFVDGVITIQDFSILAYCWTG